MGIHPQAYKPIMMHKSDFQEHIDSYYAVSRNDVQIYPQASGNISCDTCIIGGGLAGIGTALPLAEAGASVVLIEAARLGYGASGRNGGQVLPGWAASMDTISALVGTETATKLWQQSVAAVDLIIERVARLGIDCDWQQGYATAAVKPSHLAQLRQWQQQAAEQYDYHDMHMWSAEQLQQHLGSQRYVGALYEHHAGHLHPLNYTLGLAHAAQQAGAQIYEHSPMHSISAHQGGWLIRTPSAQIHAAQVVVAVNAFTHSLQQPIFKPIEAKILPVGTYMIATAPLGERAQTLIGNNMAVCDTRFVLDYYRLSGDKRLLFGGKVNYSGREPNKQTLMRSMRRDMLRVFPQLADVAIDYAWGGHVDISMNRAPHFGRIQPNLYFLQGFSGHGVAATGIGGLAVAEAILGDDQRLRLFETLNHRDFPGGRHLRLPAQWLGLGYYRLKDMLP